MLYKASNILWRLFWTRHSQSSCSDNLTHPSLFLIMSMIRISKQKRLGVCWLSNIEWPMHMLSFWTSSTSVKVKVKINHVTVTVHILTIWTIQLRIRICTNGEIRMISFARISIHKTSKLSVQLMHRNGPCTRLTNLESLLFLNGSPRISCS